LCGARATIRAPPAAAGRCEPGTAETCASSVAIFRRMPEGVRIGVAMEEMCVHHAAGVRIPVWGTISFRSHKGMDQLGNDGFESAPLGSGVE
jgi:hypothetical protein